MKTNIIRKVLSIAMVFGIVLGIMQIPMTTVYAAELSTEEYRAYQSSQDYKYPIAVVDGGSSVVAYCFNAEKEFPYDHNYKKLTNVGQDDLDLYSDNNPQIEELSRTLYNGYPYNASGIKETYGLTDMQFQCVTQAAMWNYTDPSMITELYNAYSGEIGSSIIQINKAKVYLAWNTDGSNYFPWTSEMDDAFDALTNNITSLASVPSNYKLDLYVNGSGGTYMQNLLTLREEVSATGTLQLEGNKTMTGVSKEFHQGEHYTFSVKENGVEVSTGTTSTNEDGSTSGVIEFTPITYSVGDIGTHIYTITENNTGRPGVTYDESVWTVEVEVSDNGDGTLRVDKKSYKVNGVEDTAQKIYFNNRYSVKPVTLVINGKKKLNGREIVTGEFEFAAYEADENFKVTEGASPVATAKVTEDGTFSITLPEFDDFGDQNYVVREIVPSDAVQGQAYSDGIVYDFTEQHVTARVSDNGDGTLNAYIDYGSDTSNEVQFINNYISEKTSVSGTKTWDDNNNQAGKRPESITVNLLSNGTVVKSKTVTANDNWTYSFDDLPKYEDGAEIIYTVTEDAVTDYTATYDGYNIKNTYVPSKTSITVTKVWDDQNNKDGIRPSSVEVQLYANGDKVGNTVTLSSANNWTYTWSDLDEKSNGQDINYSVEEVTDVSGYTKTEGIVKDGKVTITNKHTPSIPNEPDKPKPTVPNTGDNTNLGMWFGLSILSLAAMIATLIFRKKYTS